jgi:uncharacterized membrane-anchored protein YitT (DUF2179 family)
MLGWLGKGASVHHASDEIIDRAVALIVSALTAIVAAVIGVFVGGIFGSLLLRVGLNTDEVAAWSPISLGLPIGTILAVFAFIYTFRKFRRYGEPE